MAKIVKKAQTSENEDLATEVMKNETAAVIAQPVTGGVLRKDVREASLQAQEILQQAQQQAREIKSRAKSILDKVESERQKAIEEGYAKGQQEGYEEATELVIKFQDEKEKLSHQLERDVVRLVYDIAEKILGREFKTEESTIVDLIRQSLQGVMGQRVTIMVNPQDVKWVKKHHSLLLQSIDASKNLQIRADERVKPNGCLIETEIGTIDAQLSTQLQGIRKALGIDEEAINSVAQNNPDPQAKQLSQLEEEED